MKPRYPTAARDLVLQRDGHYCQRCSRDVLDFPASVHHRRPAGMGGTKNPLSWDPSNLVLLCGSATTPNTCHEWTESQPTWARAGGWLLRQHQDPRVVPMLPLWSDEPQYLSASGWSVDPPAVTA